MASTPTQEQYEEFVLACRFGDLEDVEAFTKEFGFDAINDARDDRGNTALHMICGNGHLDVLKHLIPHLSKSTLEAKNANGSPAIHWAVFNNHLPCVKALVEEVPEERGGGISILKQKNRAGREAFEEALFAGEGKEEVAGWIEGYIWKIEGGDEEEEVRATAGAAVDGAEDDEIKVEAGDEVTHDEAETVDEIVERTKDVEIKQ